MTKVSNYITLFLANDTHNYVQYMMLQASNALEAELKVKAIKPEAVIILNHEGTSVARAFAQLN